MKKLKIIDHDPYLEPFRDIIIQRHKNITTLEKRLCGSMDLRDFANGHNFYGLHKDATTGVWTFREWAPNATALYLIGDFSNWQAHEKYSCQSVGNGQWELKLEPDTLKHKDLYKLLMVWDGGQGERIPAWARRVVQNKTHNTFDAQVWEPDKPYEWLYPAPDLSSAPLVYEAHVGMSSQNGKVASFKEFAEEVIPHIKKTGYNTIQLMAIQEHPYYGSFGYHVSNFFAVSSRFGTPDDLKQLIDLAHKNGLYVIMDLVHSHAVKNEVEGISRFDGTYYQYFHDGLRGQHMAWDSRCFNYAKNEVLHFLLSNCKYWIEEFRFDGFRFDGVTSMLYLDHGLGSHFSCYDQYFNANQDEDAISYLGLANKLIHQLNPKAITVAEEMSGMPGLASSQQEGGIGFDYRLAMGVPDYWIKLIKEVKDEMWQVGNMYYTLTNKRDDEKVISYAESHDQALVGDQTIIFRLIGADMYYKMSKEIVSISVDRGIALHKMIRLLSIATAGGGYLNFMGNEFGHPEWIDFPREGNNWSYHYARRQWQLMHDKTLKYHWLYDFDKAFIKLFEKHQILKSHPHIILHNDSDQVLIFQRKSFVFIFNFSPNRSYTDYGFFCAEGAYKVVLNSDASIFGGYNRVDDNITYVTSRASEQHQLKIYLPARTAIIINRIPKL